MPLLNSQNLRRNLLGAIVLAALPFSLPYSVAAQQLPPLPIEFRPGELANPGRPGGRRRGGGSRGSCQEGLPLSAIAYADTQVITELGVTRTDEIVGTLTTIAQPSLLFYLPQALSNTPTEFILKDSSERLLYQGQLIGSTDGNGIVVAPLPVALSPNMPYQWSLTVDCNETERTTVSGWIERRSPSDSLANDLGEADSQNRAALYANAGFLQDALTELASLRKLRPDDAIVEREWQDFLTALDLSDLVNVPVLDCCVISDAPMELTEPTEPTEETLPEDSVEPSTVEEATEDIQTPTESSEPDTRTILQRARDRG
ncbi:DUF928 domain-containing protein [cf. Phormidesmis sp. LEGE 11477]|uniref:DUF928 domain-containing protein n=1 Tax=cf. Phormidesmis sp. LEGE 11477 TaxID=1828680 RepID=UPI0018827F5F|nr:DUF928 domain-containing protein [cf. Phormidesmis sp. LEGE 11477]MBE9059486.1 DUF928 domain-containing protein [cf. Phormidesmis sp. LEGE 11477]